MHFHLLLFPKCVGTACNKQCQLTNGKDEPREVLMKAHAASEELCEQPQASWERLDEMQHAARMHATTPQTDQPLQPFHVGALGDTVSSGGTPHTSPEWRNRHAGICLRKWEMRTEV